MPAYDYRCTQCLEVVEITHSMMEKPVVPCPQCGGLTEKQLSSGAGILKSRSVQNPAKPASAHQCGTGGCSH